jgi:hypothetical protein
MINLAIDLFVLMLVFIVTGAALLGWGNLTWRCLGMSLPTKLSTLTIWLGFCVVLSVLELINLFVPINWSVTIGIAAVGCFGLWYKTIPPLKNVLNVLTVALKRYPWQSLIVAIMILLWCLRAMGTPNNYDSGLYHFQSIRWLNEQPIVLGLGNLHWRLALNQAYFGFLALLNFAPFWNKGYAAGGLFILLLTLLTVIEVAQKQSAQWKFSIGIVLFISLGFVAASTVNPSPDNAVTLLEIVLFLYLLNLARSVSRGSQLDADFEHCARAILFLCTAVVLIKLSSLGFALGSVLCLLLILIYTKSYARVMNLRMIVILSLFLFVHSLRGYLLSGAPLFPSTILGAWDLSWAVPKHIAIFETDFIFSWARIPSVEFFNQTALVEGWFVAWLTKLSPLIKLMFTVSILLMLINGIRLLKGKGVNRNSVEYLLYLPVLFGLFFWFVTAPDVRFLGAVLVLFFGLSVYLILQNQTRITALGLKIQQSLSIRHVELFVFTIVVLISLRYLGMSSLSMNGWSEVTKIKTETSQTQTGRSINIPANGNQCWDSALPCASIFNDRLDFNKSRGYSIYSVKPE